MNAPMVNAHMDPSGSFHGRFDFSGQVALVTGAGRGLGRAFTTTLAEAGARVIGVDVSPLIEVAQAVHQSVGGRDGVFFGVHADVTDAATLEKAVREAVRHFGRLDIVVANAGVFPVRTFEETTPEQWREVMEVNVDGVANTVRAVLPAMREAGYGRVVVISSGTVWFGAPELVPYVSSKAALLGFVRSLAAEVSGYGITVNAITPGLIATEGVKAGPISDMIADIVAGQLVKRPQRPEDLASTLLWLASPATGFVTGQTINVDGGFAKH